jgi:hypothetical protein
VIDCGGGIGYQKIDSILFFLEVAFLLKLSIWSLKCKYYTTPLILDRVEWP